MTLRHIRIFLAVCDHDCNVTRAAQALYMAQPAVSAAIRELEEEYGVRLFDRISRRFSITEAGRRFYQYARQMDALYGDMDREMRGWNTRGLLRVGCSITVGSRMMPEIVRTFGEDQEDIPSCPDQRGHLRPQKKDIFPVPPAVLHSVRQIRHGCRPAERNGSWNPP